MEINVPIVTTIAILTFLLILFILAFINSKGLTDRQKGNILNQLEEIKYSMAVNNAYANRDGIVRLDTLLSKTLQKLLSNGLKCGDNLKKVRNRLNKKEYDAIWSVHKLRNNIVHENIELTNQDAINAYKAYSEVITKLIR